MVAMEFNRAFRHPNVARAIGRREPGLRPAPEGAGRCADGRAVGQLLVDPGPLKARDAAWQALQWTAHQGGHARAQLGVVSWPPLIWAANSPQWLDRFKGTHIADVTKVWETGGRDHPGAAGGRTRPGRR